MPQSNMSCTVALHLAEVDCNAIRALRSQGLSWEAISAQTGVPRATCQREIIASEGAATLKGCGSWPVV